MAQEITSKNTKVQIPEKYKNVVLRIADNLLSGFVCFLNPDNLETEFIFKEMLDDPEEFESATGEKVDRSKFQHLKWDNFIVIRPLNSINSFLIMEDFANQIDDKIFAEKLTYALEKKRPFANFKHLVDNSDYREDWFDFRNSKIMEFVYQEILNNI